MKSFSSLPVIWLLALTTVIHAETGHSAGISIDAAFTQNLDILTFGNQPDKPKTPEALAPQIPGQNFQSQAEPSRNHSDKGNTEQKPGHTNTDKTTPDLSVTEYEQSPVIAQQIKKEFVPVIMSIFPKDIQHPFSSFYDVFNIPLAFEKYVSSQNMLINDMASATTFFLLYAYAFLYDKSLNAAQFFSVHRQFKTILASDPETASLSDQDKQRYSERLYWMCLEIMTISAYIDRSTNSDPTLWAKQHISEMVKKQNFDLDRLELTDLGFAPKAL